MFKYTGLHIKQCLSEIQVDQRGYVESIKPIALGKRRSTQKYDDLNQDERRISDDLWPAKLGFKKH